MPLKFKALLTALAANLVLVSCAKQDVIDNGSANTAGGARTIAVSFANASVKSELGEDGLTPKFVAGDKIKVSNGTDAPEDCTVSIDGSKEIKVGDGASTIAADENGFYYEHDIQLKRPQSSPV